MKSTKIGSQLVLGLAVVAFSVGGCASVVGQSYSGRPTNPAATTENHIFGGEPEVVWLEDVGQFALTLAGSSSCPDEPTQIDEGERQVIEITLRRTAWPFCSTDMSLVTYELDTPPGIDEHSMVRVLIGTEQYELDPRKDAELEP